MAKEKRKVLLIWRMIAHYRVSLMEYLNSTEEYEIDIIGIAENGQEKQQKHAVAGKPIYFTFFSKPYKIYYSKEIVQYVKRNYNKYDVIILEGISNLFHNIPLTRFLNKVNKGYIMWDAGRRRGAKMSMPRKMIQAEYARELKNADAIIAYSSVARDYFLSLEIPAEKIFLCINTIYTQKLVESLGKIPQTKLEEVRNLLAPNGERIVLYVGVIEKRKRIEDLIAAYQKIRQHREDVVLVIVGGGDHLESLRAQVNALKIQGVKVLGEIIDGVMPYFSVSDLFVLPSEGGLALNQAMICAKPIIASSADGTEVDLIEEGKNGYLFEEYATEQLAEKIEYAIDNQASLEAMGMESRRIIQEKVNERTFKEGWDRCILYALRQRGESCF